MDILEIINKKDSGMELNKGEIEYAFIGYINGEIPIHQMNILLEKIKLNGMSEKEVFDLTDILLNNDENNELEFDGVDRCSIGAVDDKTSIVLYFLIAALGVKISKICFPTLDNNEKLLEKLNYISEFSVSSNMKDFKKQVDEIGIAFIEQSTNLVFADNKVEVLNNINDIVPSIPLMASLIMCIVLKCGTSKVVVDLKFGNGSLLANKEEARKLSELINKIGYLKGKQIICVLTNMDQPLGYTVGGGLEIGEIIDTLKGNGPSDLNELVINLGAIMLSLDKGIPMEEAIEYVENALKNGLGYEKLEEFIEYQKGNINNIEISSHVHVVKANKEGYIKSINVLKLRQLVEKLSYKNHDENYTNFKVGFALHKKIGDKVAFSDDLVSIYFEDKQITEEEVLSCFDFSVSEIQSPKLIYEIIK